MIIRIWKATATSQGAAKYADYFANTLIPELHSINGFESAYLLNKETDGKVNLETHTIWSSLDAIKAFAKEDVNKAVIEDEAKACLLSFNEHAEHFDAQYFPNPD